MATAVDRPIDQIDLGEMSLWANGPPHALFDRLRAEAPIHWSPMADWDGEPGFWSITRADDVHTVSRDWEAFSSEKGGVLITDLATPVEVQNATFIGMDPPRHDRIKALFQRAFTPNRIAEHEQTIRQITVEGLDRLEGRDELDLATELAQPVVGRVIGTLFGLPAEDDAAWAELATRGFAIGDEELQPGGNESAQEIIGEVFTRASAVVAERRANPTDDLTSLLVHGEIDGDSLTDDEIVFGFGLLVAAGNDSTKSTFTNGMLALLNEPEQRQKLLDDPSLIPAAVEEFLRMYPAFAHFRRTATRDYQLRGTTIRKGDKVVMWYTASNRDPEAFECPHMLDVERNAEHQAFGGGGRHFCLGTALARLELKLLFEETLARFPQMELVEQPESVRSLFINQPRAVPVKLGPSAG